VLAALDVLLLIGHTAHCCVAKFQLIQCSFNRSSLRCFSVWLSMQAVRRQQLPSPALEDKLRKRATLPMGNDIQAAGTAAAAADGRGNAAKRVRFTSSTRGGSSGSVEVPAAESAAAAGAAAGSTIPGVDYDVLQQLTNTQEAKQLGASGGQNK
jgi:hypothetical protein